MSAVLDTISATDCAICGANLRLVGKVHRCVGNTKVTVVANKPAVNKPDAVNSAVNKVRGAYPATDQRRAYMRAYMARRRAGG